MADSKQGSSEIEKPKRKHKQSLGRQCAAYGCDNRTFKEEGGERVTSKISFFTFPDNANRVKYWCSCIKRVNGKDNFKVTKTTVLCEKHFRPEDIYRPPGGTKKRLSNKETVIPYFTEDEALDASSSSTNSNTTNLKKQKPPASRASPRKKCRETQEPFPAFPEPQQDPVAEPEIEESIDWKAKYHELLEEHNLLKQQLKLSQSLKFRLIDHVMGSEEQRKVSPKV
uniref:THAP-type domain-containing protein n=1 Tax=Clytia hemisphaerica TaxID=252671 RepID=A0A7M5XJ20_9CNID